MPLYIALHVWSNNHIYIWWSKFIFGTGSLFFFSFLFSQLHWLFESKFLNPTRSNAWVPGFDRVARVKPYLKKSKQRRFSKKNKSQRVAIGFLTGFYRVNLPGHTGSWLFLFFLQPDPVTAPGRVRFQNYGLSTCMLNILASNISQILRML
jgi:hypothetical protein